jgi:phenylacetate-CoA ligase
VNREQWKRSILEHVVHRDAPADGTHWAPELECAARDELEAVQGAKLSSAVAYMYEHCGLFRRKCDERGLEPGDVTGIGDLTKLPVTTKEDMSADLEENPPWGSYTAVDDDIWATDGWQLFHTSGTTSTPRSFRYTQFDRELWTWTNARALYAMGIRSGKDSAMLCFGYGPHVAMWGMHYALNAMRVPIVTGGGLDTHARAGAIDRYRPTTLAMTPSYALYLGMTMKELEPMPPTTADRIRSLWDAELAQFYGCTEAAPSCGGYTCEHALHFMEDTHVLETLDPETLEPVPPGERGVSVVTNLCSEASPQIRFMVGDFTVLDHEPCRCGRTHVRAEGGFAGRADEMLNVRGVTLFPSAIENLIRGFPELGEEFEIVLGQKGNMDELTLVVEVGAGVRESDGARLAASLEREFRRALELRPSIDVRPYGSLPKTEFKAKRVRDERP